MKQTKMSSPNLPKLIKWIKRRKQPKANSNSSSSSSDAASVNASALDSDSSHDLRVAAGPKSSRVPDMLDNSHHSSSHLQNDLLMHIYEEIPALSRDNLKGYYPSVDGHDVVPPMSELDFYRATEVGPYLVVPIVGKQGHCAQSAEKSAPIQTVGCASPVDKQEKSNSPVSRVNSVCAPDLELRMNKQWLRMREQRMMRRDRRSPNKGDQNQNQIMQDANHIQGDGECLDHVVPCCYGDDADPVGLGCQELSESQESLVESKSEDAFADEEEIYCSISGLSVMTLGEEDGGGAVAILDTACLDKTQETDMECDLDLAPTMLKSDALASLHELIRESIEIINKQNVKNTSQESEPMARKRSPRKRHQKGKREARSHDRSSYSSSDSGSTYSSADSSVSSGSDTKDAYEYFLSKCRKNLELKQEVMRIIRESETETDDAQSVSTTYATYAASQVSASADTVSLTTVTTVSDNSTDSGHYTDSPLSEFDDCSHYYGVKTNPSQNKTEKSTLKKCEKKTHSQTRTVTADVHVPSSFEQIKTQSKNQDSSAQSASKSSKRASRDKLYSSTMDKLSCRATAYKPKPLAAVEKPSKASSPLVVSNSVVYSGRATSHNKLLQDMMRMNHDRQLFTVPI